ncbi:hypothetical protein RhiJN_10931 [Ceratobasidium sp. AG-Ba]|nr:hypothetical protein RhiJN_10931 [Ceratobasidium sp. AG-Ba]QRW11663.1 hypothetical protein RhiLY_10662 [Ceratobasidium sp. AG-Ba]
MNVRVTKSSPPSSAGYRYAEGDVDRFPHRYLLLHAKGVNIPRSWPPATPSPALLGSFRVIPIHESQAKSGLLGSSEINMSSIKSRRELTDSIPILELTRQVLETWVDDLTSWELIGWVKEYNDRHQLVDDNSRVQVTILARIQTNEVGDFVFKTGAKKLAAVVEGVPVGINWSRVLVWILLVACFAFLLSFVVMNDL